MKQLNQFVTKIEDIHISNIAKIRNIILRELVSYTQAEGFNQLMPILMSPFTDPLNHAVYPAEIEYEGKKLRLTASMIFHKQLSLAPKSQKKIFIMSPNIRLEKASLISSDNHLLEFSQFDLEIKDASMFDVMSFMEKILCHVIGCVKKEAKNELEILGRNLPDWKAPFPVYSSADLHNEYGDDFEKIISEKSKSPCFITNFKREFYDKEDLEHPGTYRNFDIIYPEGFGEASSGAEREFQYNQIMKRMKELDMELTPFSNYLELAEDRVIPATAGAGLGIERLLRYISGKKEIKDISLFDRSVETEFLF